MTTLLSNLTLFNFEKSADVQQWRVVDDVVMGGRSSGSFQLNAEGHGVFSGSVSLENNGGFSSVRYQFAPKNLKGYTKAMLRIKGDGKAYQFRLKQKASTYYSYTRTFETSGQWETIEVPLNEFYPTFRGMRLDEPNFNHEVLEQIGFLISNKKAEQFELQLDKIWFE